MNETKKKIKIQIRENQVIISIFQNVHSLIQAQILPLQTAEL